MATSTSTTATYIVTGMTCGHCVSSVTEEVSAVPGVDAVLVDLATASLTVTGASATNVEAVRVAVEEAGYALAPSA